ncbi:hypothetical protein D3C86_1822240 [compost metagenome]
MIRHSPASSTSGDVFKIRPTVNCRKIAQDTVGFELLIRGIPDHRPFLQVREERVHRKFRTALEQLFGILQHIGITV